MNRKDFLDNLRLARNLLQDGAVTTQNRHLDSAELNGALARAAIWLTPSSIKGFRAEDFSELGAVQQRELADSVKEFERIARQVPPDVLATDQQVTEAKAALEKILAILENYLPNHEEATQIQNALGKVDFPPWILNWDYEVGNDHTDDPSVWITVYLEEGAVPPEQVGRRAIEMIPKFRAALKTAGIRRWPYIHVRSGREHRAG